MLQTIEMLETHRDRMSPQRRQELDDLRAAAEEERAELDGR